MPDSAGVLPAKRRLAVGKPSVRPSCLPRTTWPSIAYGRPSRRAASAKSPPRSASRMRVLDTRSPSQQHRLDLAGGEADARRPCAAAASMSPARRLAEAELRADPDFARRTAARPAPCATNSSALIAAKRAIEAQQADAGRRRARAGPRTWRAAAVRRGGGAAGAKNSRGSGSKLSATAGTPSARARATAWRTSARWPEVQAVEGADADHTAVRAQGPAIDVTKQPAHGSPGEV